MSESPSADDRLLSLRRAFDEVFAAPPHTRTDGGEALLAIRVARNAGALRLRDIGALAVDKRIVGLPTRILHLLGLVGVRGNAVPVYSLSGLLGDEGDAEPPRWLVLSAGHDPIGFAFQAFEGYLRVARDAAPAAAETSGQYTARVVRAGGVIRPVIDIPRLLKALEPGGTLSGAPTPPRAI